MSEFKIEPLYRRGGETVFNRQHKEAKILRSIGAAMLQGIQQLQKHINASLPEILPLAHLPITAVEALHPHEKLTIRSIIPPAESIDAIDAGDNELLGVSSVDYKLENPYQQNVA